MAKIAVELERSLARRKASGGPGHPVSRVLARGDGWTVEDVICTAGPDDHSYEEQHATVRIAVVAAGSFQYRAALPGRAGRELMTPGSLLLGCPKQHFECGHEHGEGDRCVSFGYTAEYFEKALAGSGPGAKRPGFQVVRVPPLRETAGLVARACAGLAGSTSPGWEELSLALAVRVAELTGAAPAGTREVSAAAAARVTQITRAIEEDASE